MPSRPGSAIIPRWAYSRSRRSCVAAYGGASVRSRPSGTSFTVAPGETYGLLGPNGAGKTTTISMVCGLLERRRGDGRGRGRAADDAGASRAKAAIGYVPQELAIYPDLSAARTCASSPGSTACRERRRAQRVDEVLEVVGLAERGDDRATTYSGGMKRRLNIGIGLLHRPRLLVLDEPTVGVDPQSRNAILESVERLAPRRDGRPLHDPLHGGGRAPLRPDRDHRPRRAEGGGDAARARRARRRARPGAARRRAATSRRAPRALRRARGRRARRASRDGGDRADRRPTRGSVLPELLRTRDGRGRRRRRGRGATSRTSRPSSSTSPGKALRD